MNLNTTEIWQREYDAAKNAWPEAGEECWLWYANEAVQAALDGYSSVAS